MNTDLIISTNDPETALEYLQKSLLIELDEEKAKPILDLVKNGKIRIADPDVYNGSSTIFPELICTREDWEVVELWYKNL